MPISETMDALTHARDDADVRRLEWVGIAPNAPYFVTDAGRAWMPIGHNDAVAWPTIGPVLMRPNVVEAHFRTLRDSGVTLVPGTDSMAGFGLHRELELWNEAGIPAAEVLRAATLTSARVMKKDRDFGTIEAGKMADLLLVEGDPLPVWSVHENVFEVRHLPLVFAQPDGHGKFLLAFPDLRRLFAAQRDFV